MDNGDSLRFNGRVLLKKFFLGQGGDSNEFFAPLAFDETSFDPCRSVIKEAHPLFPHFFNPYPMWNAVHRKDIGLEDPVVSMDQVEFHLCDSFSCEICKADGGQEFGKDNYGNLVKFYAVG